MKDHGLSAGDDRGNLQTLQAQGCRRGEAEREREWNKSKKQRHEEQQQEQQRANQWAETCGRGQIKRAYGDKLGFGGLGSYLVPLAEMSILYFTLVGFEGIDFTTGHMCFRPAAPPPLSVGFIGRMLTFQSGSRAA